MAQKKYAIYLNESQLEYMANYGINILSQHNHEFFMELKKEVKDDVKKYIEVDGKHHSLSQPNLKGMARYHQSLENLYDQILETYKKDDFLTEWDK